MLTGIAMGTVAFRVDALFVVESGVQPLDVTQAQHCGSSGIAEAEVDEGGGKLAERSGGQQRSRPAQRASSRTQPASQPTWRSAAHL